MKKLHLLSLGLAIFAGLIVGCGEKATEPTQTEPPTLLERLQALDGCTLEEIDPPEGAHYERAFQITIVQPVDHDNPDGPAFTQRMFLSHFDESAPMVLVTWGYDVATNRSWELAEMLQANQLYVAHRYHGDNKSDPFNWEDLTVEQAAGDHHRITELFKTIYTGPWVNFGISKGGLSAAFHRRFYPNDVVASVVVVAPFFESTHDLRVDDFLSNTVGTEQCRDKIRALQRLALSRRATLLPLYENYAQTHGYSYTRVGGIEAAFEYDVLEYSYIFWQYYYNGECDLIPDSTVTDEELFEYLQRVSGVDFFRDAICDVIECAFYQIYTQMGYYGFVTDHLDTLLKVVGDDPSYEFMAPQNVPLNFDPSIKQDVVQWLETEGNNMIYVYGGLDPCTVAAMNPGSNTNSLRIIKPGANHLVAINDLDRRQEVLDSLHSWLGLPVNPLARSGYSY
jgi:hypothetical protein